jgi:hypothetical protein
VAATVAAASTAVAVAAAAAAAAAVAVASANTYERGCSGVLFIEDIERRQADVRDFLLTESDFVRCRPNGCRGCAVASDNDNPAAPNNGTAHARLFRFETCFAFDMVKSSHTFAQTFDQPINRTLGTGIRFPAGQRKADGVRQI